MRTNVNLGRNALCCSFAAMFGLMASCFAGEKPDAAPKRETFEQQAKKIAETLGYKDGLQIEQNPLNGKPSYSAILTRIVWTSKNMSQFVEPAEVQVAHMKLPEAERLKFMNRHDDHIQLWAVVQAAKAGSDKAGMVLTKTTHQYYREIFYLGGNQGFDWYGFMTVYDFANVEKKLSLQGEDILPILIRNMTVKDPDGSTGTSYSCFRMFGEQGVKAIPFIDKAIADRSPQQYGMIGAMTFCTDKAVTQWLMGLVDSPDAKVTIHARWALLNPPRKEAADLYVKWLAENIGKREVLNELMACWKVNLNGTAALLPKILASPAGFYDYSTALKMTHELAGKPGMPKELDAARQEISEFGDNAPWRETKNYDPEKVRRAVETILRAEDPRDAAITGLGIALIGGKGGVGPATHEAGVEILRRTPNGEGKRLVRLLVQTARNDVCWDAIAKELDQ